MKTPCKAASSAGEHGVPHFVRDDAGGRLSRLNRKFLMVVFMARMAVKVGMGVHDSAMGMAMGVN